MRSDDTPHAGTQAGPAPEPSDAQPSDASFSREPQQVDLNPPSGGEPRAADGIRAVRRIFQAAPNPPRFPMYVRQAKQFMRNVDPTFDERKYGFGTLQDLLRACQREGLFRIERDRQGVIRLFPGNIMQPSTGADDPEEDVQRTDDQDNDLQRDVVEAPIAESAQVGGATGRRRSRPNRGRTAGETATRGPAKNRPRKSSTARSYRKWKCSRSSTGKRRLPAPTSRSEAGARASGPLNRAPRRTDAAAPRARKTAAKSPRAPRARKTSE